MPAPSTKEPARDFIVIGTGAGGAPAAARLAENGFTVLVLEQGRDLPSRYVDVPLLSGAASLEKDTATSYYVEHFSDRARALQDPKYVPGKGIVYPRGTGRIGGSTQVNVQVWVRVDDADWDHCAEVTGDDFWRARNMRELLRLVERCEYRPLLKLQDRLGRLLGTRALRNRRGHGFSGYIETTRAPVTLVFKDCQLVRIVLATVRYALRLGGWGDLLKRLVTYFDPNDDRTQHTEGLALTPMTVNRQGRRAGGVRDRLLAVQEKHPDRLTVLTGATVRHIELDARNEAVAVHYVDAAGAAQIARVGREVIVAAGAFETPAILLRSGIGPGGTIDRRGVGQGLHDRYEIGLVTAQKRNFALLEGVKFDADPSDPAYAKWLATGRGVYATNGVVVGFQMKSAPGLPDPDLYVFCLPAAIRGYEPDYFRKAVAQTNMLTWLVLHENKGDRRGTVELDPENPAGPPKINFHYHAEERAGDSGPLVVGLKAARAVTRSYARLVQEEVWPGAQVQSDAALATAIESCSWGHHANGSARMGRRDDPLAVVDGDLKVIGAKNVRIADASVFPRSPGSFIVSAVVQVGEAAAIKAIAAARGEAPLETLRTIVRAA
jgi:choline dehydrogenase